MDIINLLFFLENKNIESNAPIKRVTPFNPKLKRIRNSYFICKNGISEKVYPREFKSVLDIGKGINTVDFYSKDFLKEVLSTEAIISSQVTYTSKINGKKGYILEIFVKPEGKLQELYQFELMKKAEKFFEE